MQADAPRSRPGPGSDDFDPRQHIWDGNTWWTSDHKNSWAGTKWSDEGPEVDVTDATSPPSKASSVSTAMAIGIGCAVLALAAVLYVFWFIFFGWASSGRG